MRQKSLCFFLFALLCAVFTGLAQASPAVRVIRVPDGGIQPRVAVGPSGRVHMIYYKGENTGDIYYVSSTDGGRTFTKPLRINTMDGSVIAAGTVRGAQLALGKNERAHVAWMGKHPQKAGDREAAPMLYTRMNDDGTAFERERNVISGKIGLDGGGSIAADTSGNIYVVWHAPSEPGGQEADRTVWVTESTDDGATFRPEQRAWTAPVGACACCGIRVFVDARGDVYILYRSAEQVINRDMYLLVRPKGAANFRGAKVAEWKIAACMMATASFTQSASGVLGAWETEKQVYFAALSAEPRADRVTAATGTGNNRKHPVLAANNRGEVLLAWTEGTAWARGGSIAWQVYDQKGAPIKQAAGKAPKLPVWGLAATFADANGDFVIVY